jgi:hypothetical protein
MASLPTRTTASFDAIKPVSSLVPLDNEFNQYVGASGIFNGGTTATKLLVKTSDATDPPIALDQIGAGALLILKQNGSTKLTVTNAGLLNPASSAVNTGFNADLLDGLEAAAFAQLATHKTAFSVAFFEADPSTGTVSTEDRAKWVCPDGNTVTITKLWVSFGAGSHTAGGSVTFTFRKRNGGGTVDIGAVTLDNTNNTIHTVYKNDIGDVTLAADDMMTYFIARSGTVTERSVSVGFYGKQLFTT